MAPVSKRRTASECSQRRHSSSVVSMSGDHSSIFSTPASSISTPPRSNRIASIGPVVHRRQCSASARPSGTNTHRHHVADQHDRRDLRRLLPELLGDHEVEHRRRQRSRRGSAGPAASRSSPSTGASSAAIAMPVSGHTRPPITPRRQSSQRTSYSRTPSDSSIIGISASPTILMRDAIAHSGIGGCTSANAKPSERRPHHRVAQQAAEARVMVDRSRRRA